MRPQSADELAYREILDDHPAVGFSQVNAVWIASERMFAARACVRASLRLACRQRGEPSVFRASALFACRMPASEARSALGLVTSAATARPGA